MKQNNKTNYILLLLFLMLLIFPSCDTQIDTDLQTALENGNIFEAEETAYTYPVADAGIDESINIDGEVQLDGSWSSDADGDTLTYDWRIINKPPGSTATLSDNTDIYPTFTADTSGRYELELTVNDGTGISTDTVIITVVEDPKPPEERVKTGDDLLDSIDTCFISALSG